MEQERSYARRLVRASTALGRSWAFGFRIQQKKDDQRICRLAGPHHDPVRQQHAADPQSKNESHLDNIEVWTIGFE